ncbi:MAG: hypothetical protein COU08_01170 [Candidatus Harrisonbacteria bacterium CG10_big_fil_rev_8_21_14_0_10_42_17]|uniref:Pyrroloquinoline quinone-dependent pyranose dehydrogenase beta-propeller domain-containing protein n=1 Tax=Candidatus Harrisonbacteria bacterium CG10_big_fil_rev_8_21_14_0_10_42_17 TaxID=1974584 RepID=A0A2M6WII5_9BACT|nr:MAG: hypothetical protein COU08_01170 [Candidatus Harrisonbacteria bacterium CG10_big_fil_rev_8_21_14_0_10_42_17]
MKRLFLISGAFFLIVITTGIAFIFHYTNLRPILLPPPRDIGDVINGTEYPLTLPDGFEIGIYARDLGRPRVMIRDSRGYVVASLLDRGEVVVLPDENHDGVADQVITILSGLNRPHGLAMRCVSRCELLVAETDKVVAYNYVSSPDFSNIHAAFSRKLIDLPSRGNHTTRTLGWLPGAEFTKLLVSIGSTCNVCREENPQRAAIYVYDFSDQSFTPFAAGLRNTVFFTVNPIDGSLWGTDMGRDLLGDDTPPDEINVISSPSLSSGQNSAVPNFGWPTCYGKNIHDTQFDKNTYIRNPCMEPFEIGSHIDIPAHSAPLGLAFIPEESFWPEEYWLDLLVAYHGSWNRAVPTGYKIVRMKLDHQGNFEGVEDFISGWLQTDNTALGRPVDVLFGNGGELFITDDKAGVIYRVVYGG